MAISAYIVPNIYNASSTIKDLAKDLILIGAVTLPIQAFNCCCYFTLRAGGKVFLTMLFDCFFVCLIRLPVVYIIARFTTLDIRIVYFISYALEFAKTIAGYILVKKGIWLKHIV